MNPRNRTRNPRATVRRFCHFCVNQDIEIDYKESGLLRRFTSSYAKIAPRRRSGMCASHQRKVAAAIKRARIMALLPFVTR